MNRFNEIFLDLKSYKSDIDRIVAEYRRKDAENKKIYNAEAFTERHLKNMAEARQKVKSKRDQAIDRANMIFGDIQDDLKHWITAPIPANMIPLFTLLLSGGVKVSGFELEALAEKTGNSSYMAQKILAELAGRSGLRYKKPDIESFNAALSRAISSADVFLTGYIGQQSPLAKELLPDVNDHIIHAAASCRVLSGESSLLTAALLWDGSGALIQSEKKELSEGDREVLNLMFEGCRTQEHYETMARKIVAENPEIKEILRLSDTYSQYLPKEDETSK